MKKTWLTGPILFVIMAGALTAVWAITEPAVLTRWFDQSGFSPFELATLPVFAAIVPVVWWKCPFEGSKMRRVVLCTMVSMVAIMAIVKETDLHMAALKWLYPEYLEDSGSLIPGMFVKPNGKPLTGTPFKMRVLTNGAVPLGMKAAICAYFAMFFGVFAAGFAYLLPSWIRGVMKLEPCCWSIGCFGASGVLVQISDRLPAWVGHAYGLDKHAADGISAASSLCTCMEEGGEMMIAIFAILAIMQANDALKEKR